MAWTKAQDTRQKTIVNKTDYKEVTMRAELTQSDRISPVRSNVE